MTDARASDGQARDIRARIRRALENAAAQDGRAGIAGASLQQPPPEATALLTKLRHQAAILGFFNPDTLVRQRSDEPQFEDALDLLSRECRAEARDGRSLWSLLADSRRAALADLVDQHLIQRTAQRVKPRKEDRFGRYMRATILGKDPDPETLGAAAIDDLLAVREFLFGVLPMAPKPSEILGILLRRFYAQAVATVLPTRLIGRRAELKRLKDFVEKDPGPPPPKGCIVTGVGGSGKSALMAGLLRSLRRQNDAPAVIILDFDHPLLAAGDPVTLTHELTRQLCVARPDLFDELSKFRESIPIANAPEDYLARERFESVSSRSVQAMKRFGDLAKLHRIDAMKIVLILDTFEEVLVRGPAVLDPVLSWISELSEAGRLRNLRPILCGRASPTDVSPFWQTRIADHIELGDLSRPDSILFLRSRGLRQDEASVLARPFGGNPLTLRLLAQDRLNHRDEPLELPPLTDEAAQTYLFDRILNRIGSPRIRALAHPGLVLRRVTPTLIRQVLAPECGLGELDDEEAKRLFEELSNEVWLVKRTDEAEVVHHRDLRRLMLPGIRAHAPERARKINHAAAEYYAARLDPDLSANAQATEALYHRLMAEEAVELDASSAHQLAASVGGDLSDLPEEAQSRVRFHRGHIVSGRSANMFLGREYGAFLEKEGRRLVDVGRPGEALALLRNDDPGQTQRRPSWLIEALFARGRFSEVVALDGNAMAASLDPPPQIQGAGAKSARGMTNSDAWRAAIAPLLAGEPQSGLPAAIAARKRADVRLRDAKWAKGDGDRLTALALVSAAARVAGIPADPAETADLFDRATVLADRFDARRKRDERRPVQGFIWTRLAALAADELNGKKLYLSIDRLPMFNPDFVDQLVEWVTSEKPRSWPRNRLMVTRLSSHAKLLRSSKATLASLDRSLRSAGVDIELRFDTPPQPALMLSLLRATTPELRSTAREAIADVFVSREEQSGLAEALESIAPVHVPELKPERFGWAAQRDARRWISVMLLFADRANVFGELLNTARGIAPGASELNVVATALQRFDQAFTPGIPHPLHKLGEGFASIERVNGAEQSEGSR